MHNPRMLEVPHDITPLALAKLVCTHSLETVTLFTIDGAYRQGPALGQTGEVRIPESWRTILNGSWVVHSHTKTRPASKIDYLAAAHWQFGRLWVVMPSGTIQQIEPKDRWPIEEDIDLAHSESKRLAKDELRTWQDEELRKSGGVSPPEEVQNQHYDRLELEHQAIQFGKCGVIIEVRTL